MTSSQWIVLTTVAAPGPAVRALVERCGRDWSIVVVGDESTPDSWADEPVCYLSLDAQDERFGELSRALPRRHYCRKNLGYLHALQAGAERILETDDDNSPLPAFGQRCVRMLRGRTARGRRWLNPYAWFGGQRIWPRGMPLDCTREAGRIATSAANRDCPIQQYLVNGDPDVDAVFRLVDGRANVEFDATAEPLVLEPGTFAPFNSQNTLFFADVGACLYLPHAASFRMTDIWRSLVAQAALWVHGSRLAFQPPTAVQERNPHDLMRDFADEIPGYLRNAAIAEALDNERRGMRADGDIGATCRRLWEVLVRIGDLPPSELSLLDAWLEQVDAARPSGARRQAR